jgi:hypothetical protein
VGHGHGRIGVGGWWDMDSKNRKKRVYGVGGRIGVGMVGHWTANIDRRESFG